MAFEYGSNDSCNAKKYVPLTLTKGLRHWHVPSCTTRSITLAKQVVDTFMTAHDRRRPWARRTWSLVVPHRRIEVMDGCRMPHGAHDARFAQDRRAGDLAAVRRYGDWSRLGLALAFTLLHTSCGIGLIVNTVGMCQMRQAFFACLDGGWGSAWSPRPHRSAPPQLAGFIASSTSCMWLSHLVMTTGEVFWG